MNITLSLKCCQGPLLSQLPDCGSCVTASGSTTSNPKSSLAILRKMIKRTSQISELTVHIGSIFSSASIFPTPFQSHSLALGSIEVILSVLNGHMETQPIELYFILFNKTTKCPRRLTCPCKKKRALASYDSNTNAGMKLNRIIIRLSGFGWLFALHHEADGFSKLACSQVLTIPLRILWEGVKC